MGSFSPSYGPNRRFPSRARRDRPHRGGGGWRDDAVSTGVGSGSKVPSEWCVANPPFNVGVDLGLYFSRHVGVGFLTRYSKASLEIASGDDENMSVDVGGVQVGAGVRFRF